MNFVEWGNRAAARVAEIGVQQAEVAALVLPLDAALPMTVGALVSAYRAAGANATWLPAANAAELGSIGVAYNLADWEGGQYQFVSCDLPRRGAEYVGSCEAKVVTCSASSADGIPFGCTRVADGSTVPGNLSSSIYRTECELPCDLEQDCGALCDCGAAGCASSQVRVLGQW
jgi:hypothetical protein